MYLYLYNNHIYNKLLILSHKSLYFSFRCSLSLLLFIKMFPLFTIRNIIIIDTGRKVGNGIKPLTVFAKMLHIIENVEFCILKYLAVFIITIWSDTFDVDDCVWYQVLKKIIKLLFIYFSANIIKIINLTKSQKQVL